ncbi:type II toxin-antitoxin system VapC family toxin [Conexibacter sp. DBS9H8]|uniref:type II toxin-antitoxin system VapC family toxin n=1 Tax=Conexibacter sp. DBS9H8 TaxID=2937801 RepID=UPI0035311AA5
MARLIVLDASVAIAALTAGDPHHRAAAGALARATHDELVIAATTRAEILVGPSAAGAAQLSVARDFVDGCETVPVTSEIADAAARWRAAHRALSLPDAIALVVADLIDADEIWTFDARWCTAHPRVVVPAAHL